MGFLSLLWRYRGILVVSAVLAAVVGLFFGLTGPITFTSNGQLLLPATDPVTAGGNQSKADNSLVGIQLKAYADNQLSGEVSRKVGADASQLNSLHAMRQRDPVFYKISADADRGPIAREAVQTAADLMIAKAGDLAKTQVDHLQTLVTERLGPLDGQSVTAAADVLAKQQAVDSLNDQVKSLQGQIDAARAASAKAAVTGNGSVSNGSAVASSTQTQLDNVNKQLIPAQTALQQAKSKQSVIDAQRQGLQDQVQKATDSYLSTLVASALVAPPSKPFSGRKLHLVTMVGLEILVSLAVGASAIAWGERRQIARMLGRGDGRRTSRRRSGGLQRGLGQPAAAHAARRR